MQNVTLPCRGRVTHRRSGVVCPGRPQIERKRNPGGKLRGLQTRHSLCPFSPGIRQGIVISLAVKTDKNNNKKIVRFRDDIDAAKADDRRAQLLQTLTDKNFDQKYEVAEPEPFNLLSFRPRNITTEFKSWPSLEDLAALAPMNGLMEKRGGALIDVSADALTEHMRSYFDDKVPWGTLVALENALTRNAAGYDAIKTRSRALLEGFAEDRVRSLLCETV